jgi:hypothetical protein
MEKRAVRLISHDDRMLPLIYVQYDMKPQTISYTRYRAYFVASVHST